MDTAPSLDPRPPKTRDEFGRYLPGTVPGPGRGHGKRRRLDPLVADAIRAEVEAYSGLRTFQASCVPRIPEIAAKLTEQALEGDTKAALAVLRYCVGPGAPQETRVHQPELAALPPDLRLQRINELSSLGQLSLEEAGALATLTKAEAEAGVFSKLREMAKLIRAGKDMSEVVSMLAALPLGEVLEHEAEERD